MSGEIFTRAGLALRLYARGGTGRPVVMQHGLTGAVGQIDEWFRAPADERLITLECRGHGASEPGPLDDLSIATFADDLIAVIERLRTGPVLLGGVSMGAAIASRIAVKRPDLVAGLMLIRPAWVTTAGPDNLQPNIVVGELMQRHPPGEARALFNASATAAMLATQGPDNLASMLVMFDKQPIAVTAALLTRISRDGPGVSATELAALSMPTLVVGHHLDVIHPFAYAEALGRLIPGAQLVEITPKATDKPRFLAELAAAVATFITGVAEES